MKTKSFHNYLEKRLNKKEIDLIEEQAHLALTKLKSFYFVRHGQTDWNKNKQELCDQDNMPLNNTGLLQAAEVSNKLDSLKITKIYSSPLMRAKQTAEIINKRLTIPLEFHKGLGCISPEIVSNTFIDILESANDKQTILVVSHGEIYRVLLQVFNIETTELNAKNGGLYLFKQIGFETNQWSVHSLNND